MNEKPDDYNLLVKPWIPVLYSNGDHKRVGIRTALLDAGRIRQIAASNPMDRLAILRFLLALLYWCKGNPPEDSSVGTGDSFPAEWFSKLDENQDCFNLLGNGKRFYQDRDAQRSRASTDLIQEIPTGNNFWHFRHSTDKIEGLCPACCAMGLLRLPLFSVSGLPDLKSGINGTPPVYAIQYGPSLLETLCANWATPLQLGDPAWVQPNIRATPGKEVPLLTGLTLPSRRVWLHESSGPPGACSGCGVKRLSLIRTCEFQTAGKQENDLWNDPHVVYLEKTPRKTVKAPDLSAAGKFRMDRPWPNLLASIVETCKSEPRNRPISLYVIGFATDQAKNIDVWERTLCVPSAESIQTSAISLLQQWHSEGGRLEKQIGKISRSATEGAATVAAIRPHIEHSVSAKAIELLGGGQDAWEQVAHDYRPMMAVLARSLSPGFTAEAVQRRKQIASMAPDMRPRAERTKKTRRKKGDEM